VTSDGAVGLASQVVWSTDARETLAFGVAGATRVAWQFPGRASTGAAAFSPPSTDGERLFVCEGHERAERFVVYALRASTGGIEWTVRDSLADWSRPAASPAEFRLCQPVVAGDTVMVGYGVGPDRETGQGVLIALSTSNGRERWRRRLPVAPEDVAVTGSRVYVGDQQRGVLALAPD
jgi:outer membrane protein assembly factor BamB